MTHTKKRKTKNFAMILNNIIYANGCERIRKCERKQTQKNIYARLCIIMQNDLGHYIDILYIATAKSNVYKYADAKIF